MRDNEKEYLKSEKWQKKRLERLRLDDFKCCRCGTPHNIQVHHTSYEHLCDEDIYNDLVTLCDSCHESIEKETRSGCEYHQPINVGSNYGIKNVIKVPIKNGIIYKDMMDVDITKQIQFKGGKIRLCKAHLSYNDFLNNKERYDEAAEYDSACATKGTYKDYQYTPKERSWYVFVECKKWIHEVQSNAMNALEIRELQNGIVEIFCVDDEPWEGYESLTKQEHDTLVALLDKCENFYNSMISQKTNLEVHP